VIALDEAVATVHVNNGMSPTNARLTATNLDTSINHNNVVFFKIKRTAVLGKLLNAPCDRQGKNIRLPPRLLKSFTMTSARYH
jgi:hypothetical protein